MTTQIKASEIGDSTAQAVFAQRVEAFRQAKLAHHKTVDGESAPTEHHLVEACVRRVPGEPDDYVADYEIIQQPTLDERKAELTAEVHRAETAALHAKLSPAKRRLHSYALADVTAKKADDIGDADKAVLIQHDDLTLHANRVGRHAAQLLSDIEDLTEQTIGQWQMPPFPA